MHGTNSKSDSKYFMLLNLAIKDLERLTNAEEVSQIFWVILNSYTLHYSNTTSSHIQSHSFSISFSSGLALISV
jgi:hypothetical protein